MIYQSRFQASEPPSKALVSSFKYSSDEHGHYHLHCHAYYEFSYIISGERYEYYNGEKYRVGEGSLFLVPPLVVHGNENITPVEDIILQFSLPMMADMSAVLTPDVKLATADAQPYIMLGADDPEREILREISLNSTQYLEMYESSGFSDKKLGAVIEFRRNALFLRLMAALVENGRVVLAESSCSYSKALTLDRVINRILDHPESIPEMSEAAVIAGMSYFNFSRIFREAVGMNYSEYCNAVRIQRAEELLIKTDLPVSEVAAQIGIDTPSYFTKLFRKLNSCTPAEYRKMFRAE